MIDVKAESMFKRVVMTPESTRGDEDRICRSGRVVQEGYRG